jgi:hypothetical protein
MADMIVYCIGRYGADRSHEKVIVREFDRTNGDARWWELPAPEHRRPKPSAQRVALTVDRGDTQDRRFRLECEECELQASARSERLWDLFDEAASKGAPALPLRLIVATLSGTEPRR